MLHLSKKYGVNRGSLLFTAVFALPSFGNVSPALFEEDSIITIILLLVILYLLIVQFFQILKPLPFKISETVYVLFVVYLITKELFANTFNFTAASYLVFLLVLYYSLKGYSNVNNLSIYLPALSVATATILVGYIIFSIYHSWFQNETLTNFFFPNKSIFSILLASQIAFIIPIVYFYKQHKILSNFANLFLIGLIAATVILLSFTQGRAGCIGLAIAIAYMAYQYLSATIFKRLVLFMALPAVVFLTAAILLYKSDSSNGRLLIYKVSAGMLKENWLWGIGHGQFKIQYNQYQAAYFAAHNIDSKEALLADNTFFAFNDLLQAVIENGLVALLFLAAIILFLVLQIKKAKTNADNKHFFTASVASLLCIVTGTLFSYPLQILPIAIQATLCLCIINSFETEKNFQIELPEIGRKIVSTVFILLSTLLLLHFSFYFNYKRESNQAFELKRAGFRQKAIDKYEHLNSSYIQDGNMLYLYAQELYYINQLTQARETLNRAKKSYCTHDVYKLSAAIESELKNYKQAEADYKTAINMVPNRMASRNELFGFYLERKDTASAIYWANSILNMPVKVASEKTKNIRQKTKKILNRLIN